MICLTGGSGQLGQELQKLRQYLAPSHTEMDITDPDAVQRYLGTHQPTLIVHAAAYTDTLKPESDPQEAVKCYRTNVLGTRNLIKYAVCPILFISTESAIHPYNFYILTKLQAEHEFEKFDYGYRIIRTSFRFNPFEYPRACDDMYTIADTVGRIAPLIDAEVDRAVGNDMKYVGRPPLTIYDLAKETRPDVIPVSRTMFGLPAMTELLDV